MSKIRERKSASSKGKHHDDGRRKYATQIAKEKTRLGCGERSLVPGKGTVPRKGE